MSSDLSLFSTLENSNLKENDVEIFVNYVWNACRDSNDTRRKRLLEEINEVVPLECNQWHLFKIFCETISSLTECFRYDACKLRLLVCAASMVSIRIGETGDHREVDTFPKVTSMISLYPLHIWNNIPLWIDMTDKIVIQDFGIIDSIYMHCPSNLITTYFFGWKRQELKIIFLCNRIAALVQSMRTFGLKNDIIDIYLTTIKGRYKMTDYNFDVNDFLLNSWINEVLSACIVSICKLSSKPKYVPNVVFYQYSLPFGYGDVKETNSIGYSTILAMLLLPAYLYISNKLDVYSENTSLFQIVPNLRGIGCFCGKPITSWSIIGIPSNEEMLLQSKMVLVNISVPTPSLPYHILDRITSCICEDCYRKSNMHRGSYDGLMHNSETSIYESVPVSISPCFSVNLTESKTRFSILLSTVLCVDAEKALHRALRIPYKPLAAAVPDERLVSSGSDRGSVPIQTKQTNNSHRSENIQEQTRPLSDVNSDDMSIVSGFSKIDDDESLIIRTNHKTRNEVFPMVPLEFHQFILDLWNGITMTLIYSHNPPIEKTRILYLRCDNRLHDESIVKACSSCSTNVVDIFKYSNCQLYLGWARQSERGNIVWNPKKSVLMSTIRNIKVGSKKWSNCVKLATDSKIIVIKIEDEAEFQRSLRGLTQLLGSIC